MKSTSYTIVLEPAEEGGYNVSVPALPGCYTQGSTYDKAITMARDAIGLWLEELTDAGETIPRDVERTGIRVETVEVSAPAVYAANSDLDVARVCRRTPSGWLLEIEADR